MEVLYLDQLFAVNWIIDYCIVLAAARVSDLQLRRRRYTLAALFGALYAAASVLPGLSWLTLAPMKAAAGLAMALIAYGGEAHFWRCAAAFFAASALFGGAVYALALASGTTPGVMLSHVTLRVLLPSFAICYAVLLTVFRRRMRIADRGIVTAVLTVNGQTQPLRAMPDTGNTLRDPVTGSRAAVLSPEALLPILGAVPKDPLEAAELLRRHVDGVRLLPYAAVGQTGGLLAAFRPEQLSVEGHALPYLVALAPNPVSPDGSYSLLLPADSIM